MHIEGVLSFFPLPNGVDSFKSGLLGSAEKVAYFGKEKGPPLHSSFHVMVVVNCF